MVEQFGFAIILFSGFKICAFTSGTIKGTFGNIRHCEELSITKVPVLANSGAKLDETVAPAEKIAKSGLAVIASFIPIT